jgi:hypothetical protein
VLSKEVFFSLFTSFANSLRGIGGEVTVFDDVLMKVISEEVGTSSSSMSIIDPEKGAFGPIFSSVTVRSEDI